MYDATTFLQGSKHIIEKSLDSNYFVDKIKNKEKLDSLTSRVEQLLQSPRVQNVKILRWKLNIGIQVICLVKKF